MGDCEIFRGYPLTPPHPQARRRNPDRDRDRAGETLGPCELLIESRRGSGNWKDIGILGGRAFRATRSLAVRGQPEVREYRARFFDGTTEISGEWSPVEAVTVSG